MSRQLISRHVILEILLNWCSLNFPPSSGLYQITKRVYNHSQQLSSSKSTFDSRCNKHPFVDDPVIEMVQVDRKQEPGRDPPLPPGLKQQLNCVLWSLRNGR